MPDLEDSSSRSTLRPRFQFSLRAQMIAVTVIAVALWLLVFSEGAILWWLFAGILYCIVPTPLVISALFSRGELRVFSIGALMPWLVFWGRALPIYPLRSSQGTLVGWLVGFPLFMLTAAAACGTLAVATRRWIDLKSDQSDESQEGSGRPESRR